MGQANMENGLVNVVIVEGVPRLDYLSKGAADRLCRRDVNHLTRVKTSHLHVVHEGTPVQFSLDGEMIETNSRSTVVRGRCGSLSVRATTRARRSSVGASVLVR